MECRTRERKDGSKYKICYNNITMESKPKLKSKPKLSLIKVLEYKLQNMTGPQFRAEKDMYVITSNGNKYLDERTPKGNPIKVEQRVTYKSKDAPISMLVMPKDGDNLMVKAGKKKGNNFTLALSKLKKGLEDKSISLKSIKAVPTSEWEGSHTMPDGTKMKGKTHPTTPRGKRPSTPPRRKVEEAPAGKIAQLAKVRTGTPRRRPSEGVPPGSKRRMLKSGYAL